MPNKVLTINAILREAGLNTGRAKLVRHSEGKHGIDVFGAWLHHRPEFERYQAFQARPKFDGANHIVSFVADPRHDTVFVGVYEVRGQLTTPVGEVEPLTGNVIQPHYRLYN